MRDLASCLSEYAVSVSSDTSCSSYTNNPCISPAGGFSPSIQNCVTCLYRSSSILPNKKQPQPVMITVTWSNNASSQGLTILFDFDDHQGQDHPSTIFKITTNSSRLFRRSKGCKSLHLRSSTIQLLWDLSTARYQPGPEPIDGFYLLILLDSHPALLLGDKDHEFAAKFKAAAQFALVSRQEHFSGNNLYSTKAQFCDTGSAHEISIRCGGDEGLSVCIDKKTVIRVKKLQWNFRGNHTIFLDGLLVDLMWDVHDWFYNQHSACAVFMFRARTGLDNSRLWLEEKKQLLHNHDRHHFSFIIYASKNV